MVLSSTLDELKGLIASVDPKSSLKGIEASLGSIKGNMETGGNLVPTLELLKTKLDALPKQVAQESGAGEVKRVVNDAAQTIQKLAGNEGYSLGEIVKIGVSEGVEKSKTVQQVRKTVDQVQGATEIMQILMERKYGGVDEPVVHVLYE